MSKRKRNGCLSSLYRKPLDTRRGKGVSSQTILIRIEHIKMHGFVRGSEVSSPMGPARILKLDMAKGMVKIKVHPNGHNRHGSTQTYPATAIGPE